MTLKPHSGLLHAGAVLAILGTVLVGSSSSAEPTPGLVCDGTWQVIPSPNPGTKDNDLRGVAAISDSDAWAVGVADSQPLILHWDGVSWTQSPIPPVGVSGNLASVAASSPTNAWAVGFYQATKQGAPQTLTYHWTGTSWVHVDSPSPGANQNDLNAVTTGNDTWAVGRVLGTDFYRTLILHYTSGHWARVHSPNPGTLNNDLDAVGSVASSDALAGGDQDIGGGDGVGYLDQWNGAKWTRLKKPRIPGGSFFSLATNSSGDVLAVGSADAQPYAARRSPSGVWSVDHVGLPAGMKGVFEGATWTDQPNAWAVGHMSSSDGSSYSTLIAAWDGAAWTVVPSPNPSTTRDFLSEAAYGEGVSWAVGSYRIGDHHLQTLIEGYCETPAPGSS
jgi:hypothetical protein